MLCPQPFLKSLTLFPVPKIHTHKKNKLLNMPIGYLRSTTASTLSKLKTYPFSHKTCSSGWTTSVHSTQLPKPRTAGPLPSAPKPNCPPKPQPLNPDSLRTCLSCQQSPGQATDLQFCVPQIHSDSHSLRNLSKTQFR